MRYKPKEKNITKLKKYLNNNDTKNKTKVLKK